MQQPIAALLLCLALPISAAQAVEGDFAHLTREGERLVTRHSLRYAFRANAEWTIAEPLHRTARFNDVPFEVSLSGFLQTDAAIMIHAEHVSDGSGASNYDHFPLSEWPATGFRAKPRACFEVSAEIVEEEHDLAWLRDHGFDPVGAAWIEQYFLSGNGYNDEIVISLIVRGSGCEPADAPEAALARLRAALHVSPLTP
tara:strand:- start:587 stop:1183 length:597 start_codon:yes stop_codon:yes gene_type:complete